MTTNTRSFQLYERLAAAARDLGFVVPAAHKSLFQPTRQTLEYVEALYVTQLGNERPKARPGDATCKYCADFHLSNLKHINKAADLQLSDHLEKCFCHAIQNELSAMGLDVTCVKYAKDDGHLPDFLIQQNSDRRVLLYFELKAIFRPFIKIASMVNAEYECYSHSLTLDLSNGKKLQEQRERVEGRLGLDSALYVYWYDLPCLKGVFWMPAAEVYNQMDLQIPYDRKNVSGDYKHGWKVGSTKKLYLPLLKMRDFSSFIDLIASKSK